MLTRDKILQDVEQWLAQIDYGQEPAGLFEPIRYAMSLGGKRIRPVLCLATCALFNDDYKPAQHAAAALEVFHNFTLLHDDIMDRATLRRGKPTVTAKYGQNAAILSGDAMLIEAYRLLERTDSPSFSFVTEAFNQLATEVCQGQQLDMDFERRHDVSTDEYLEMIRLKTACLIAGAMKIGALIGGATAADTTVIYDFGILLGLVFQLQDDLLDTYGDAATFGKALGGDIMENKKTYLALTALERANSKQRKELADWQQTLDPVREEKVAAVTRLFDDTGARKATEDKINSLYAQAMASLRTMEIPAEGKRFFIDYADWLFKRDK